MTEMDSFLERLDDVLYEVWKLKKDTERCNLNDATLAKVNAKIKEGWNALTDAGMVVIRYEEKEKNNDK